MRRVAVQLETVSPISTCCFLWCKNKCIHSTRKRFDAENRHLRRTVWCQRAVERLREVNKQCAIHKMRLLKWTLFCSVTGLDLQFAELQHTQCFAGAESITQKITTLLWQLAAEYFIHQFLFILVAKERAIDGASATASSLSCCAIRNNKSSVCRRWSKTEVSLQMITATERKRTVNKLMNCGFEKAAKPFLGFPNV